MTSATEVYEVYAVRYGTRATHRADVYLNFLLYDEPDDPMGMDYFFWIIRNDTHRLVVDCGFDEAVGTRRGRTTVCPVPDALTHFGIDAATADQLLITHAHYDHIGNLAHFPTAQLLISRREYNFWTGPMGKRRQFASSSEPSELDQLRAAHAAGRVTFTAPDTEPVPGVRTIELGGHTPGQLVVTVPTAAGQVVLASDALHYYEELERDWPFLHAAHLEAMYAGFDVLAAFVEAGATLVPGHDPAVMDRFAACEGPLDAIAVRIA